MAKVFHNLVKICDVTIRDGIQGLKNNLGTPVFNSGMKLNIINRMNLAGIQNIEFGSNVSNKITEMVNTQEVVRSFDYFAPKSNLYLLVPNYKKYQEVLNWSNFDKISHLSLITACSESFVKKNTNMTIEENLDEIDKILNVSGFNIRIYISTCFGCPFEGKVRLENIKNIANIFDRYSSHPKVQEIVISDTIGSYDFNQLKYYMNLFGSSNKVSLHIHSNSDDPNIEGIITQYKNQLVSFDTSMGNIGGCPNVEKTKLKPNISTYKVASILNNIERQEIYNLEVIMELEELVKEKIQSIN
jgi:hydroxymethylglutaryl-CoA lyase